MKNRTRKPLLFCLSGFYLLALAFDVFAQKEAPPAGDPPKPFIFPKQENYSLPNGMRVTLVPYGLIPKVAARVVVRAGSLNEKAEQRWICKAVAALLKEGTTTRSAEQITRETAEMGGSIFTQAGYDNSSVGGEVLSDFDVKFLALLADVLINPNFKAEDLEKYRGNRLREITVAKGLATNMAWERYRRILFPNHPYGEIFPSEETVKSYRLEDVKAFYNDNYGAARTQLYVVGKFNPSAVKKAINKLFGNWKKGAEPVRNVPKIEVSRSLSLIDRPNAPQSTIYLGFPAVSPSEEDYIKFVVMDCLLGSSFASRITSNIRENKGYSYAPGSSLWTRYKTGFWYELADVSTDFTGASIKEILYEIDRLRNELLSAAELEGFKNYLIGIYILRNSTRTGIIDQIEFVNDNELDKNYLDTYVQKILAVTPQDIEEMARKYLNEEKMTIVVVGDKTKIADQLKPYN